MPAACVHVYIIYIYIFQYIMYMFVFMLCYHNITLCYTIVYLL